jgi:hypothetical protein
MGLVGGSAVYVSGNDGSGYLTATYATDFKGAPDCGHAADFFRNVVLNLEKLYPHEELVIQGSGVVVAADPGNEWVIYFANGGSAEIDLTDVIGSLLIRWYDPLNGKIVNIQSIMGGGTINFNCPDPGRDWVLHITNSNNNILPPPPSERKVINVQ